MSKFFDYIFFEVFESKYLTSLILLRDVKISEKFFSSILGEGGVRAQQ